MKKKARKNGADGWNPDFQKLTEQQKQALYMSMDYLYDKYLEDLAALSCERVDFNETFIATALPPQFGSCYNYLFAKKFFACFVAAMERIRNSDHPRCVAEEMAVKQILEHAISMTEDGESTDKESVRDIIDGLCDFEEALFEDEDFLFLWDGAFDGIEYIKKLGMANMQFSKWFAPFRQSLPVNPYVEDDEVKNQDTLS